MRYWVRQFNFSQWEDDFANKEEYSYRRDGYMKMLMDLDLYFEK